MSVYNALSAMFSNTEPHSQKSKLHEMLRYISHAFCVFDNPKNKNICVVYYVVFWAVTGTIQVQAIWKRLLLNKYIVPSVTVIEIFFRILIFLTNFLATSDFLFFKTDKINDLDRITKLFENSCKKFRNKMAHSKRRFLIIRVLVLISIFSAGAFNFLENIRFIGILVIKAFGPPFLLIIQTAVLVTNICSKLYDIGSCLRILNGEMYNTMIRSYTWIIIGNHRTRNREFFGFLQIYNELFQALVWANTAHSFHFFTLLFSTTTIILHICNMFVKYTAGVLTINNGDVWKLASIFSFIIVYVVSISITIVYY